jgi:uncharacterized protein YbbC (DUF1343 family)/CubicO group peptidase (beta-lactamase class C family)
MSARFAQRRALLRLLAGWMGAAGLGCAGARRGPSGPVGRAAPPGSARGREPGALLRGELPAPLVAFEAEFEAELAAALAAALAAGEVPGGVCWVGSGADDLFVRAFGRRARGRPLAPGEEAPPEVLEARFDLASLTKPVATASAVALLFDRGRLDLDRPVSADWPAFGAHGKERITPRQLLLHSAGLVADNPLADWQRGADELWRRIEALEPQDPPGQRLRYSDVGYAVLARLVERLDGRRFEAFCAAELFAPLGLFDTGFNPPPAERGRCVPTELAAAEEGRAALADEAPLQGRVHDPRARAIGGVAGHAGLFSTGADLARWCRAWLGLGPAWISAATRREFQRSRWLPDGNARALLGDVDTAYSGPRGSRGPASADPGAEPLAVDPIGFWRGASLGHTGFTGTSLWLEPSSACFAILLTSPLGAGEQASALPLRRRLGLAAGAAVHAAARAARAPRPAAASFEVDGSASPRVRCGVDVLCELEPERLRGQRLALISHRAARLRDGRRSLDAIAALPGARLREVWTPEHGFEARAEGDIADGTDGASGLPLRSLYGATRRPLPEWFAGLDLLLYDCQDVGVRFYTYATTLAYAMEAAGQAGVPVLVLDRPNPLGLTRRAGPLLEPARRSFIGYAPIPVQHGLSLGELARFFVERLGLDCQLEVLACRGLERAATWSDLGLPFEAPSPNLRRPEAVALYPLLGCFEACALSVGRGTEAPFERFGAPWLDPQALLAEIGNDPIPGLRLAPIAFTPAADAFAGQRCDGVSVEIAGPAFEPLPASFRLARALLASQAGRFDPAPLVERWGHGAWLEALRSGRAEPPADHAFPTFERSIEPLWLYPAV